MNANRLDNTQVNLRPCSRSENARNKSKPHGTSCRFRGVSYRREYGRWYARIGLGGRLIHLGSFTDEVKAARAYDRKAAELFGEFARPNFPDEWPARKIKRVHAKQRRRT